mmetsp:Transcript_6380/g.15499  ORF Transcript_6380/g.15499 Transcript_6380/m.15499 type:complete len:344 (-) Transcript_6380:447-1478(-)
MVAFHPKSQSFLCGFSQAQFRCFQIFAKSSILFFQALQGLLHNIPVQSRDTSFATPAAENLQFKLLNTFLQSQQLCGVRIAIHHDNIPNVLRTIRVLQGIETLSEICVRRRDTSYHHCPAVAPQRILQKSRNLGISVGHMSLVECWIPQRADHISKSQQSLIYTHALFEALPDCSCFLQTFGPRQVNETDLSRQPTATVVQLLLNSHCENRMGARALVIHKSCPRAAEGDALFQTPHQLCCLSNLHFLDATDDNAAQRILANCYSLALGPTRAVRIQQVIDFLVVDLYKAALDHEIGLALTAVDRTKNCIHKSRNDAELLWRQAGTGGAAKRESLASPRLTVG